MEASTASRGLFRNKLAAELDAAARLSNLAAIRPLGGEVSWWNPATKRYEARIIKRIVGRASVKPLIAATANAPVVASVKPPSAVPATATLLFLNYMFRRHHPKHHV